jgi:hypothetical protein
MPVRDATAPATGVQLVRKGYRAEDLQYLVGSWPQAGRPAAEPAELPFAADDDVPGHPAPGPQLRRLTNAGRSGPC